MRALEFYSGIGGWSSALKLQGLEHTIVAAFDINPISNEVYEHNYNKKPSSKSLETITIKYLNSLEVDLWVMSPPCQPYTRNNETESRDNNDPRSKSFLHLIDLLTKMNKPPTYIALENVVGFEQSFCCDLFINTLRELDYTIKQFHLTPTQFGIPNERPRYYCIAARHSVFPSNDLSHSHHDILTQIPDCPPVEVPELGDFLEQSMSSEVLTTLLVPQQTISRSSGWCFDLCDANSRSTACFTKSYSRYIKGTGSVLVLVEQQQQQEHAEEDTPPNGTVTDSLSSNDPAHRVFDEDWWSALVLKHTTAGRRPSPLVRLRFFSPRELTGLFGFDRQFSFPDHVPLRKRYELIGNSLNVVVAGRLLNYLLRHSVRAETIVDNGAV